MKFQSTTAQLSRAGFRLFVAILAGALLAPLALAQPASPVAVDAVKRESVTRMHRITGEIAPRRRSAVAAEEAGIVLSVPVDAGDRVKAGDVLAKLDSAILELTLLEQQAELAESMASVDEHRARSEWADADLKSLEDLLKQGAAKPKEVEDKRSEALAEHAALRQSQESVRLSQARLNLTERRLHNKTILAPFDGVVIIKHAEVGQWVGVGGDIAEVVEIGEVDAVLDVPEWLVSELSVGMSLEILPAAFEDTVVGSIRAIVPLGDARARTYPVKVALANRDGRFKPGMSVKGWVPSAEFDEALTISRDAVLMSPTGPYVYAVRDGAAFPVNIDIRSSAGIDRFVVTGTLTPGTLLVTEGNEKLYPTAKVTVVRNDAEQPRGATQSADAPSN